LYGEDSGSLSSHGVAGVFQKNYCLKQKSLFSPGIGFGQYGDDHVRFGLIENEHARASSARYSPYDEKRRSYKVSDVGERLY